MFGRKLRKWIELVGDDLGWKVLAGDLYRFSNPPIQALRDKTDRLERDLGLLKKHLGVTFEYRAAEHVVVPE